MSSDFKILSEHWNWKCDFEKFTKTFTQREKKGKIWLPFVSFFSFSFLRGEFWQNTREDLDAVTFSPAISSTTMWGHWSPQASSNFYHYQVSHLKYELQTRVSGQVVAPWDDNYETFRWHNRPWSRINTDCGHISGRSTPRAAVRSLCSSWGLGVRRLGKI